jgi:hypothetical protein
MLMIAKRVIPVALAAVMIVGMVGALSPTPTYAAFNQTPASAQVKTLPPAWGPFMPFFGFRSVAFRSFRPFFFRITVMQGQNLTQIAARFGVSVNRLSRINGIANPNLIVTGMPLFIPRFRPFFASRGFGFNNFGSRGFGFSSIGFRTSPMMMR